MSGLSIFTKKDDRASSFVDKFLEARGAGRCGRLAFIIDATASRGPTWDMARGLTGGMIREAGQLEIQLIFFRSGSDGPPECRASDWTSDPGRLAQIMARIECRAGYTQIRRALIHARDETLKVKVGAVVLIGDACEPVYDGLDQVSAAASELGKLKTPVFAFLEGRESGAEIGFRKIADLSGGAFGRFDAGSVKQLSELLKAVAAFAVGGARALEGRQDEASMLLLEQMRRKG
jgi:hypothetical protein